jgi:hypothetical protein
VHLVTTRQDLTTPHRHPSKNPVVMFRMWLLSV